MIGSEARRSSPHRRLRIGASVAVLVCVGVLEGVAAFPALAAGPWTLQRSGTTKSLDGVSFVDQNHGWAVGDAGTIVATSDGGAHWSAQTSGTTSNLLGVSFADQNHGWAVGDAGTIVATSDGGAHWSAETSGTSRYLRAVSFVGPLDGWAVGEVQTILHTFNGGATWSAQSVRLNRPSFLNGVSFADRLHGLAVGWSAATDFPTMLATSDGGGHWSVQALATVNQLWGVSASDRNHGWAAGGPILATSDGGAHWSAQTSPTTSLGLRAVKFVDARHGWAVGPGGTIVATSDGGAHWGAQTSGTIQDLSGVSFIDQTHGWAVGSAGTILAFNGQVGGVGPPLRFTSSTVAISLRTGKGSLPVKCNNVPVDVCEVKLTLTVYSPAKKRSVKVGTATGTIAGGRKGKLYFKLNGTGLAMLRKQRHHKLNVTANGSSTNRTGRAIPVTQKLTL